MRDRRIDAAKRNDPAARSTAEIVLTYPGFHALFWHRFSHFLYHNLLFLSVSYTHIRAKETVL
ncbi:hypothetical protein KQJ02_14945, partial [Enterococcus sp. S117_ASV_20]|nr:hypothetical protein [Enterococcus sp. S117_ASV_20]